MFRAGSFLVSFLCCVLFGRFVLSVPLMFLFCFRFCVMCMFHLCFLVSGYVLFLLCVLGLLCLYSFLLGVAVVFGFVCVCVSCLVLFRV